MKRLHVLVVVSLLACAEETPRPVIITDIAFPDQPLAEHLATDTPAPDQAGCNEAGCPCSSDTECASGACIRTGPGPETVCAPVCEKSKDCPKGWACAMADSASKGFCIAPWNLCMPCRTDAECAVAGHPGSRCIEYSADGRFCGWPCGGVGCPLGYECTAALGTEPGAVTPQCRRPSGETCGCDGFEDVLTVCYRQNAFGTCTAERRCAEPCPAQVPAKEVCNGNDDDCDGVLDPPGAKGCQLYYRDSDGDGFGVGADSQCLCAPKAPYTASLGTDCDDGVAAVNPAQTESCNGIDDDCDGQTDEEVPAVACKIENEWGTCLGATICQFGVTACNARTPTEEVCNGSDDNCDGTTDPEGAYGCLPYYKDADGDGHGAGESRCLCGPQGDYKATDDGDCDDADPDVNKDAKEVCNGKDDDCDGETDEAQAEGCTIYYKDSDQDGHGLQGDSACLCGPTGAYTASVPDDCDDSDASRHPGAVGVCGKDADCDDSLLDKGEPCDDGTNVGWDGCSDCNVTEFIVNTETIGDQQTENGTRAVAVAPDGRFMVVFQGQGQNTGWDALGRRFKADGTPDGDAFGLATFVLGDETAVTIAAAGSKYVVAWQEQVDINTDVYMRSFMLDGNPTGDQVRVHASDAGVQAAPAIAALPDGQYAIAWQGMPTDWDGTAVYLRRYSAIGSCSPERRVNTTIAGDQKHPSVAMYPDGRLVVAFESGDGDGSGVFFQRFKADTDLSYDGPETAVNQTTAGDQSRPSVGLLPDGGFIVVYESVASGISKVFMRRFGSDGNPVGPETTLSTESAARDPVVGVFQNGNFAVTWAGKGPSDQDGVVLTMQSAAGEVFTVQANTYVAGPQGRPSLARLPDGSVVVVWTSTDQDGYGNGVFAARFSATGDRLWH